MQFALYAVIICCTTYIGFGLSEYYCKREKLFNELTAFCERLKTDISFMLKPLDSILKSAAAEYSSILVNIVNICREILDSGKMITCGNLYGRLHSKYINEDEKNLIAGFFSVLGKSDANTQLESIENFRQRFMAAERGCKEEMKRFSPMLKKLGFLSGLAICLFML